MQSSIGPPSQLSTDALHTATPTATSRTMHIYRRQMDPPGQSSTDALHTTMPTATPGQCIYKEGRWSSPVNQADALHTATPTARSKTMHIYRRQMDPPLNQAQMPCILLNPLLHLGQCIYIEGSWTPQSIEHRCLAYFYTYCYI